MLRVHKKGRSASVDDVRSPWPSSAADGLERFPEHASWDETMGAYFRMAVATHSAGAHEAALFLGGGAAERLVGLVAEKLAHLLRPGWGRKTVGEQTTLLVQLFRDWGYRDTAELLEIIGNIARWTRNDVGHPKANPPDVDARMVAARILEFPAYVARVLGATGALAAR